MHAAASATYDETVSYYLDLVVSNLKRQAPGPNDLPTAYKRREIRIHPAEPLFLLRDPRVRLDPRALVLPKVLLVLPHLLLPTHVEKLVCPQEGCAGGMACRREIVFLPSETFNDSPLVVRQVGAKHAARSAVSSLFTLSPEIITARLVAQKQLEPRRIFCSSCQKRLRSDYNPVRLSARFFILL